jgi:hypothetical protein
MHLKALIGYFMAEVNYSIFGKTSSYPNDTSIMERKWENIPKLRGCNR